ncbi:MAG: 8-oxo-dGTP pyrophosphatase MutT (NUDIX family) [Woeseiaceae bacterium]|jgi:8-oxo-dGTP pyrophosphatase MutT (NUDIX family)
MPVPKTDFTAAEIRRLFASTRIPDDPADAALPDGASRLPGSVLAQMNGNLTPAGVLVPLLERHAGLTVLLTERSPNLKHHAGQVSFPGGRMEAADADIRITALRETHEEVGIHPDHVDIVGYLPATATVTSFAVTPVVGFVDPAVQLVIDPVEVKTAFEVPLAFLMDEANQETAEREFAGRMIPMTSFYYADQRIWGATASMLVTLRKMLLNL